MIEIRPGQRVLLVTRNLPPLVGGMERLNWHMAEELAKVSEVRVIGPAGSAALAPAGISVREAPLGPLWRFLWRARSLARREAREWGADIVLAGSGLTAPIALAAARATGAKACVYVHGLDVAIKHPAYRAIWLPAIRRAHRIVVNSGASAELCRGIGIEPTRIRIVHPGVSLPTSQDLQDAASSKFRDRHGLCGRFLLLSVGRLSTRKGLREFVTHALPRIVAVRPHTMLLIVGDTPVNALHAEAQTPASIRAAAEAAGVADHLLFLGVIDDRELREIYRAADVHVFPVRQIPYDPEGFGMVAIEAAAHGLATVAFATGGVIDAVAEGRSGRLVPPGNYEAFAEAVLRTYQERDALFNTSIEFASRFSWPKFGLRLAQQLELTASAKS